MKKAIITVLGAIMFVISAKGKISNVRPFNEVFVNVPSKIYFINGEDFSIDIQSNNKYCLNTVKYSVEDTVLMITTDDFDGLLNSEDTINVYVTSPINPTLKVGREMELLTVETDDDKSI